MTLAIESEAQAALPPNQIIAMVTYFHFSLKFHLTGLYGDLEFKRNRK